MKARFFDFLNLNTSGRLICAVLFLLGAVMITSPARTNTPNKSDIGADVIKKKKDTAVKSAKPDKSDKNPSEDFGGGQTTTSDSDSKGQQEKDNQDDGVKIEYPVIPELENETYVELARIGKLNEKQQKMLVKIQKQREATLEKWDKTNEKKLERMKRKAAGEERESRRVRLELKVEKFEAHRDKLATGFDIRARRVCKPSQLVEYNTEMLYRTAMDEFANSQLQLSDEEAAKVKKACGQVVRKRYRSPVIDLNRNKKAQFQGTYAVAKKALTKEQLNMYKKAKIREEREKQRQKNERQNRGGKSRRNRRNY